MSEELLAGFPVTVQLPVQWGEMDAYGHVNNTVFFRYFESARLAYLERCGFTDSYDRDRIGAILHSTRCRFRTALFYPDTVTVGARAEEVADDRFTMRYVVVSENQATAAAEGDGVVVSFDYAERRVAPIPSSVREAIERIEAERS